MKASTSPDHHEARLRSWVYVLLALVALFAGYVLGLQGGQSSGGSRVDWPPPQSSPRSPSP